MKITLSIFSTAIILGCTLAVHSTVLRVNNTPAITVPYATFLAAYNVAVSGNTIYLEGSMYTYGDLTIQKSLVIIGTGYYLNENPETQANINTSKVGGINLASGSSGTKIIGLDITGYIYGISPNIQNLVFMRNKIYQFSGASYGNTYINFLFEQNVVNNINGIYEYAIFRNNYITSLSINSVNNNLFIYNNVIVNATFTNGQFSNNIIYGSGNFANCTSFNNVCSATQLPAGNGNQQNVNMNDVFVCYSNCAGYSTDGRYQLKAGSPAIGAGTNGVDCGMFGGSDPYILSGMPPIPAIYYFNYNFNNTSINVDMKVKSHN